ncbi:hypothetical protein D3C75_1035690 [compost metagenome]
MGGFQFEKNGNGFMVEINRKGIFVSMNGSAAAYATAEEMPRHGWAYYISKDAIKQFFADAGIAPQDVIIVHPTAEEAYRLRAAAGESRN